MSRPLNGNGALSRLLGIAMMVLIGALGCATVTQRAYMVFSEQCPGGDSLCCSVQIDSVRARIISNSFDGRILTVGVELTNAREDTLQYRVDSIKAWENANLLERWATPEVNGLPCVSCTVMTITRKPAYVYATFQRKDKKGAKTNAEKKAWRSGKVTFDLGCVYRGTMKVAALGTYTVHMDKFSKDSHLLIWKPGLN